MAGPELAGMAIGSQVMGSVAGARSANAQEAQRNQAALDQFNQQQYNAEAQVIQSNMRGRLQAAAVARKNRAIERNSLRELFTNAESLSIEQRNRRQDLVDKSNAQSEMIKTRAMQSNIQSESAMLERLESLQTAELAKGWEILIDSLVFSGRTSPSSARKPWLLVVMRPLWLNGSIVEPKATSMITALHATPVPLLGALVLQPERLMDSSTATNKDTHESIPTTTR